MLEIKNITIRDLDGIPKKEYWVQMQLQMEVTDLDECDFLETRFKEYDSEEEFLKDGGFDTCEKIKGVIIQFSARGGPVYKYSPGDTPINLFSKWDKRLHIAPVFAIRYSNTGFEIDSVHVNHSVLWFSPGLKINSTIPVISPYSCQVFS